MTVNHLMQAELAARLMSVAEMTRLPAQDLMQLQSAAVDS
jgi:hypothetical protein